MNLQSDDMDDDDIEGRRLREPLLLSAQQQNQQERRYHINDDNDDHQIENQNTCPPHDKDDDDPTERQQPSSGDVIIAPSNDHHLPPPSTDDNDITSHNESTGIITASNINNNNYHRRLESVDVLRGIVMAVMILVDDAGSAYNYMLGHSPWDHIRLADFVMPYFLFIVGVSISLSSSSSSSRKNRIRQQQQEQQQQRSDTTTIEDENQQQHQHQLQSASYFRHIFLRTIRLFVVGFVLQGNVNGQHPFQYNLKTCRIPGILQRISFCYFIGAISHHWLNNISSSSSKIKQWPITFQILIPLIPIWSIYMLLSYYTHIRTTNTSGDGSDDDLNYHKYCGNQTYTDLSIPCNAGRIVDTWIFGGNKTEHLYSSPVYIRSPQCSTCSPGECLDSHRPEYCDWPFDPEGVLSSIASVGSTLLGIPCGHWLQQLRSLNIGRVATTTTSSVVNDGQDESQQQPQRRKKIVVVQWIIYGIVLCLLGILIDIPWNKNLYTLTYASFMGGCSVLNLLVCYYWIDIYGGGGGVVVFGWITKPFRYLGMNAIFVFVFGASDVFKFVLTSIYWDNPKNNIVDLTLRFFQYVIGDDDAGLICFTLVKIVFWMIICRWLYHKQMFFKI